MKKLLAFLLLFGAGLALLFVLQEPAAVDRPEPSAAPAPVSPEPDAAQAEGDEQAEPPDATGPQAVLTPRGPVLYRQHARAGDVRPLLYELEAADSGRPEGAPSDESVLEDVAIRIFDPDTGGLRAELAAASAVAHILPATGGEIGFRFDPTFALKDVVMTVHEGAPIVPLRVEVPWLDGDLDGLMFRSKDTEEVPVRISGPGLELSGRGFLTDLGEERFRLSSDGHGRLALDSGVRASLGSAGPLTIARTEDGVTVEARESARLVTDPPRASTVEADRILLAANAAGELLRPREGQATGNVRFESTESGSFTGREAQLGFSSKGVLETLELSGEPRAALPLGDVAEVLPHTEPGAMLNLTGDGPLRIDRAAGTFALDSPGALSLGEARLEVAGRLLGQLGSATEPPSFAAEDDVRLTQAASELVTQRLEVSWRRPSGPEDEGALRAVALGPSELRHTEPDGPPRVLETAQRLEVLVRGDRWRVPTAVGARFTRGGATPLVASAARLRDVDAEAETFRAEGDVSLESAGRSVTCDLLESVGPEHWVASGAPARFERAGLVASAARLEREGAALRAEGGVRAELDQGGAKVTLAAGRLEVEERRPGPALPGVPEGEPTWTTHLSARGDVDASLTSEQETHRVRCDRLDTEVDGTGEGEDRRWRTARWKAEGHVAAALASGEDTLDLECGSLEARFRPVAAAEPGAPDRERGGALGGELVGFQAEDGVALRGGVSPLVRAQGERLWMDERRSDRLEGADGSRVHAEGYLPGGRRPFELDADWIEFSPERIVAENPEGRFAQLAEDEQEASGGFTSDMHTRARRIEITREGIALTGGVEARGTGSDLPAWSLSADRVDVAGSVDPAGNEPSELQGLTAEGDVAMDLGPRGRLLGERLRASAATGSAVVTGDPALLQRGGLTWESERLEYDMNHDLPASGAGRLYPNDVEDPEEAWQLEYESLETLVEPDRLILAMRNVVYTTPRRLLRASWAAFWVDRRLWEGMGSRETSSDGLRVGPEEIDQVMRTRPSSALLFQKLQESEFGDVLRELYLEGPIEIFEDGVQFFNAEAFFLDAVDGHGWIADADLYMERSIEGHKEVVTVHADWLRHSQDGALHASDATMTSCTHDDPHMWITTRGLTIVPLYTTGKAAYDVEMRSNSIHLFHKIALPMGTIHFQTDEEGHVLIESLRLGSSGRLGNFLEATIERDMGGVGKGLNKALGGDPKRYRASYRLEASYLGSRGVLLDVGARLRSEGRYWWNFHVGGLDDRSEDRGLIEIPLADRDSTRLWYRSRGRFPLGRKQWLDLAFSSQTDPGVQSEFWENDYLRWEERETDLHWRKAWGASYASARALVRVDEYRTETERLPEVRFAHTPTPLGSIGPVPLLYSTQASAAWLKRLEGTFEAPFADGLGERDVLRVDNTHRVEAPIDLAALGAPGVRATPFVELRGTSWDEDVTQTSSPTRGVLAGGVRVATTLWKMIGLGGGGVHELAPFVELCQTSVEESGGVPVSFDRTEDALQGGLFTLGLRSRWLLDSGRFLDVEVRRTRASNQAGGVPDGWRPLEVFAGLDASLGGVPLSVIHDARYDLAAGHTAYSLTSLGCKPTEKLTIELGHRNGDEPVGTSLFESATIAARYRWTPKWEFEALQTLSLLGDQTLATKGVLRRYGHDLLFDIELTRREGEGSSIGFSIRPLLGWRPSPLGVIGF